jgi:hypothetical protein
MCTFFEVYGESVMIEFKRDVNIYIWRNNTH